MRINQTARLALFLFASGLVTSCGSSGSDKDQNAKDFAAAEDSLNSHIEEVAANMPSPTEIPYLLQATGAEFNGDLLNPRTKVDSYASQTDKAALNLGVYAADIGYLTYYDKTQEAIDYLNSCKSLADNLNVLGSFDVAMLKRFEDNIANKDSLARLLDGAVNNTEHYLRNEQRSKLAAMTITGSFVEGLYISTGLVDSYPKDILPDDARNLILTPLIRVILEQKKSVENLQSMLQTVDQAGIVGEIMTDLTDLKNTYAELNIDEQIKNNRADLVLSDKNLVKVSTIVKKMRTAITG